MYMLRFVKIHWYLLKLLSRTENMDVLQADNSVKNWRKLPISNPKPNLNNINAHTKFRENPFTFTKFSSRNENTDWQTYNRWMDRHTDSQLETLIHCHYHVGIKMFDERQTV